MSATKTMMDQKQQDSWEKEEEIFQNSEHFDNWCQHENELRDEYLEGKEEFDREAAYEEERNAPPNNDDED